MNNGSSIAGRPACWTIAGGRASSASNDVPNCVVTWANEVRGATMRTSSPAWSAALATKPYCRGSAPRQRTVA